MVTSTLTAFIRNTLPSVLWQREQQPTLQSQDVSVIFHEPAILSGYRVPYKPWRYYFWSILHIHNETVNIWTHLLGTMFIIYKLVGYCQVYDVWHDSVMSIMIPFGVTCLICLSISTCVHLLHSRSPYVHFVGFMMDYIGAAMTSFGYGIAYFYGFTDYETYKSYKYLHLSLVTAMSFVNFLIMCLAKLWYGHDPHNMNRKYMMLGGIVVQFIINVFPANSRYINCFYNDSCSVSSLNHINIIPVILLLQAISFAAHQPEKTWPRKFDIAGHGHQIFHLFVVGDFYLTLNAMDIDYKTGLTRRSEQDLVLLMSVIVFLVFLEAFTLSYLVRYVPNALKRAIHETQPN